jgi:hypothetical protein
MPCDNFQVKLPLGTTVVDSFLGMKPPSKCQATYVWIDGTGEYLRSKTRTFDTVPNDLSGRIVQLFYLFPLFRLSFLEL